MGCRWAGLHCRGCTEAAVCVCTEAAQRLDGGCAGRGCTEVWLVAAQAGAAQRLRRRLGWRLSGCAGGCPRLRRRLKVVAVGFRDVLFHKSNTTCTDTPTSAPQVSKLQPPGKVPSSAPVLRTGAVNSASGSAYAEFGNTKVIVSVFGPRESKKAMMYSDVGRLNCNVSYTTFATPVRGQGSDSKEFSSILHKALEGAIILDSFPKTTVDVFALVLESGGSDLPVVISCASLALADAGIMMYDLVASVSVARQFWIPEVSSVVMVFLGVRGDESITCALSSCLGKNLVIDPISEEESYQDGSLMITCTPSRNEITQLTITGEWSTPRFMRQWSYALMLARSSGRS
ncbi:3'-5'-exoribonuclease family protein [Actinidia rufa]|uniref:3'-5'-exoribonuclease family protein n=1 Tax=Actinidia rufa TaxID=165716 RepID=A0A7J0HCI6_9ERIC|nr:3'-5'-exoribonuclease family protein [Actinidia rufa]